MCTEHANTTLLTFSFHVFWELRVREMMHWDSTKIPSYLRSVFKHKNTTSLTLEESLHKEVIRLRCLLIKTMDIHIQANGTLTNKDNGHPHPS